MELDSEAEVWFLCLSLNLFDLLGSVPPLAIFKDWQCQFGTLYPYRGESTVAEIQEIEVDININPYSNALGSLLHLRFCMAFVQLTTNTQG